MITYVTINGEKYVHLFCGACEAGFAIQRTLFDVLRMRAGEMTFWCPNGHARSFVKPTPGEKPVEKPEPEKNELDIPSANGQPGQPINFIDAVNKLRDKNK